MKRGLVIILLLLAACAVKQPGQAVDLPVVESPAEVVQPSATSTVVPVTRNKMCMNGCTIELNKCRYRNKAPFDTCTNYARRDLKLCLNLGDDAYCRLQYSKSREICFNSYVSKCDILFNSCTSKC